MEEFREAQAAGDTARANRVLGAMEYLLQNTEPPAERVTRKLNDWVAFLVLPLFALANAGVTFSSAGWASFRHSPVAWGIVLGLVLGKPVGILATCFVTAKLGVAELPRSVTWTQLAGISVLAGIGFTVSLFIGRTLLRRTSSARRRQDRHPARLAHRRRGRIRLPEVRRPAST